jgi:hypothetical protein
MPDGTGALQVPSGFTVAVDVVSSGQVTVTVSPGTPEPVTLLTPGLTGLIAGGGTVFGVFVVFWLYAKSASVTSVVKPVAEAGSGYV